MEKALHELGEMDDLTAMDSPIHRLSPLAKLLTAIIYIIVVVSFRKYDLSGLAERHNHYYINNSGCVFPQIRPERTCRNASVSGYIVSDKRCSGTHMLLQAADRSSSGYGCGAFQSFI